MLQSSNEQNQTKRQYSSSYERLNDRSLAIEANKFEKFGLILGRCIITSIRTMKSRAQATNKLNSLTRVKELIVRVITAQWSLVSSYNLLARFHRENQVRTIFVAFTHWDGCWKGRYCFLFAVATWRATEGIKKYTKRWCSCCFSDNKTRSSTVKKL